MKQNLSIQDICNSPDLFQKIKLIPVDHVLSWPRAVNYKLVSAPILKSGKQWFEIFITDKPLLNIAPENSQQGDIYQINLTGRHPKLTSDKLATHTIMSNRRFIIEIKTINGDTLYLGSLSNPMRLKTQPIISPYNGFELLFSSKTIAPFYFL